VDGGVGMAVAVSIAASSHCGRQGISRSHPSLVCPYIEMGVAIVPFQVGCCFPRLKHALVAIQPSR
jgi:hypothetical protein